MYQILPLYGMGIFAGEDDEEGKTALRQRAAVVSAMAARLLLDMDKVRPVSHYVHPPSSIELLFRT